MAMIAVIDTETNWNDAVMSVGAVILSGEGDVAGWFMPDSAHGHPLWLGEWSGKIAVRP